jgi:hypothetical protein
MDNVRISQETLRPCHEHAAKNYEVRRLLDNANVVPSSPICHPDEGGAKFLRNVCSYKSTHGITYKKTPFFMVTAVKTSNLNIQH